MAQSFALYCVNLQRSPDRRAAMAERAAAAGLEITFVEAVDGRLLSAAEAIGYRALLRKLTWTAGLSQTEIACLLSHRKAIKTFLAGDASYAVILEDDIRFAADFTRIVDELCAAAAGWELVRLESRIADDPGAPLAELPSGRRLVMRRKWTLGGGATLFRRDSAARLLSGTERYFEAYDNLLGRPWAAGCAILEIDRPPAAAGGFPSTIEEGGAKASKTGLSASHTMQGPRKRERRWWRLAAGLHRAGYGAVARLRRRAALRRAVGDAARRARL